MNEFEKTNCYKKNYCKKSVINYLFAENALRSLLEALTSPPYAPMQHLEREQALAKQFAEILHFTLSFDELKVSVSTRYSL